MAPVLAIGAEPVVVDLFFGLSSRDGRGVSDQQWQTYIDEVLARSVPGFTIQDCQGGWRDGDQVRRESCKHVIILADPADLSRLTDAVTHYKTRFDQQSVLWLERPCTAGRCRFE